MKNESSINYAAAKNEDGGARELKKSRRQRYEIALG